MSAAASWPEESSVPMPALPPGAWWRHLFDESEDAQCVCDRQGVVLQSNPRAGEWLALAPGARLCERPWVPATIAAKLAVLLARDEGRSETLAAVPILNGGQTALVADVQVTLLDRGCSLVTVRDASTRWRVETHAQRLLGAIDATPDVVLLTDAEFRLTFVNPAFQAATGYTLEEALGRTPEFLRAASEGPKLQACLERVRGGRDWAGEFSNTRRDGSLYPVEATMSPIYDRQGNFLGAAAFERDVSAKKQLQDELVLERNFVRSIINSLDAGLYTLDGRLRLTHCNEGWKKMPADHGWLHFDAAPEIGRCLLDYVPDAGKSAELKRLFKLVLAEGQPQEIRAMDAGGHHWLMSIVPWQHDGIIRGLIYKVTDNTTFISIQNQLFQAQKMETIGALAAGVAHDFNNLLLAIRGNVGLLMMDQEIAKPIRARLQQIDHAANRAADVTHQLLSFSRESEEKIAVLDFNQVIQEAGSLAKRTLRGRVQLKLEPSGQPLKVRMDSTRAQQLLLNLCINAQDAMPQGGQLTVTNALVELTPEQLTKIKSSAGARFPADVKFMRCSVADSGTGIPPEVLARIFNPFFTTKEKGKGTGLGLSIAHGVMSKAGGFIEVESVVGRGTTFHLYLPVDLGPLTASEAPAEPNLNIGSGRLLVVDDLDLVLEFAGNFLQKAGYEVLAANSAEAAMKILGEQPTPVDLVLTDYTMPGKNGWQLIQEIAARWPGTKFILASGYLDDGERAQIETTHGVRIMNKPYSITEATGLIAEMLKPNPSTS